MPPTCIRCTFLPRRTYIWMANRPWHRIPLGNAHLHKNLNNPHATKFIFFTCSYTFCVVFT
ncbi:AAEL004498-PA [Aedes aegypti]|uniref:AAEL004498-PA n=1 Tax=Aedes aegypti TaxID=7159 RepID=Q0IFM5_AEDAE|nr:AAEL004498-PA [Aedes aegypti]